jgi:hypothetical protein
MKKEEAAMELLKHTKEKEEILHEVLNQPLSFFFVQIKFDYCAVCFFKNTGFRIVFHDG